MYVVILGAGRVGSSLASWFLESGSEVAVIDSDKKKTQILDEACTRRNVQTLQPLYTAICQTLQPTCNVQTLLAAICQTLQPLYALY